MAELDRASEAIEPGTSIEVPGDQWVDILTAEEADRAVKFILTNQPEQVLASTVSFRLSTAEDANEDPDDPGNPRSNDSAAVHLLIGGSWEEERYAGPVCARSYDNNTTVTKGIF